MYLYLSSYSKSMKLYIETRTHSAHWDAMSHFGLNLFEIYKQNFRKTILKFKNPAWENFLEQSYEFLQ